MKNNKKYTISEAAAEAMGLGAISDGKPDYDATGKSSVTPAPIVSGMPATTPVGAPVVPNSMAGMAMKTSAPVQPQVEEEDEEAEEMEALERDIMQELGFARQALHAATLGFVHPLTQEKLSFESALPADIVELIGRLSSGQEG